MPVLKKGFLDFFNEVDADFFCVQETKLQEGQINLDLDGYYQYWNYAIKKGYSGTAIFTKHEPLSVAYGIRDGRTRSRRTCDYIRVSQILHLVTVYTPNSQNELARLEYRMQWEQDFRSYLTDLETKKPVIICGDLNVAHQQIDLKNPKTNTKNPGFTPDERNQMTHLLNAGFVEYVPSLLSNKRRMLFMVVIPCECSC